MPAIAYIIKNFEGEEYCLEYGLLNPVSAFFRKNTPEDLSKEEFYETILGLTHFARTAHKISEGRTIFPKKTYIVRENSHEKNRPNSDDFEKGIHMLRTYERNAFRTKINEHDALVKICKGIIGDLD